MMNPCLRKFGGQQVYYISREFENAGSLFRVNSGKIQNLGR